MPISVTCLLNNRTMEIDRALRLKDEADRLGQSRPDFRCTDCRKEVRPHRGGGHAGAHFEHLKRNPKCPLSHRARGSISVPAVVATEDDESAFPEGRQLFRQHQVRERDSSVARKAKLKRLTEVGRLICDVCEFDFEKSYGPLGIGFIEAHHTVPISKLNGTTKTRIADFALVCSNCHRMLHRSTEGFSVADLRRNYRGRP